MRKSVGVSVLLLPPHVLVTSLSDMRGLVGVLHQDMLHTVSGTGENPVSCHHPVFSQPQHGGHLASLDDRLLQPGQD